jgi:glycosyltransferase involved in cell wall biosynthesis
LRALADVPGVHFALIGKGEGEAEVKAQVALHNLGDRVHFYGFRDADLPLAIASLDVSILLAEGNDAGCRAVLESMSCAVPVIGADLAAVREALEGAGAGLLIPPEDRGPLIAAMRELAESPRDRIGSARWVKKLESGSSSAILIERAPSGCWPSTAA